MNIFLFFSFFLLFPSFIILLLSSSENLMKYSSDAIFVVVANPMDTMTHLTLILTGLPRNRVIGIGGLLDSSRFKCYLSQALRCNHNYVHGKKCLD